MLRTPHHFRFKKHFLLLQYSRLFLAVTLVSTFVWHLFCTGNEFYAARVQCGVVMWTRQGMFCVAVRSVLDTLAAALART